MNYTIHMEVINDFVLSI